VPDATPPAVVDNPDASRFELHADGKVAVLEYELAPGRIRLVHTEVPPELRGRKYGDVLARAGLDHARAHHLTVAPFCPFVRAFLARHRDWDDILDEHWKVQIRGAR